MSSNHTNAGPPGKLRILVVDSGIDANGACPNYPQFGPSPDCPYPGWCLEIIDVILRSGNISHEFVVDRNETQQLDWGRLQANGSFSGVLGRVESGEVDMACLLIQKSVMRMEHFDYSVPISEVRPTFIIREAPLTFWSLILNCLRPYDTTVWIGIVVALIVQMFVWTLIGRTEMRVGMRPQRLHGEYFAWDVFEEMFNGGDHPFYFLSGKLARLVFAVFQKGLLPAMYTALLLTALLTPVDSQADAARLIKSGEYKLISDKSKWFAQDVQLSSEKIFVELREATKNNPIIDTISDAHSLALVDQGGYIFQTSNDESAFNDASVKCYTFIFSKDMPSRSAHLVFQKGSPWRNIINAEIMKNYIFFDQDRKFRVPKCERLQFAAPGSSDPLDFWSVSGIFVLASCGLIISAVSFIAEIICSII
ncbi:hypothetical protein PRIPAC_85355 [Pristionchus pacificus]|uniref:Uncharacterized protein n=1 Tax=Pristionchus pacificus TaxID=54126 RepID=A0A2A6BSL1_PRIPA|nr:hypothetical protein PRIPAC_85355 [Pristionchus pacificus]|eukprot:PDM68880.1 hypothetical protein PRIPAC_47182 [Pristionchus pacificus]